MAYQVTSNGRKFYYDAIETYAIVNSVLTPVELLKADGFKAFTIIEISPWEERMIDTLYVFPGHILSGYEADEAIFEYIEEPEEEEEEVEPI